MFRVFSNRTTMYLYPSVTILLMDSEGKVYENKHLTTAWVAQEEEPNE